MKTIKVKNLIYSQAYNILFDYDKSPRIIYHFEVDAIFFGDRSNNILRRDNKKPFVNCYFNVLQ
jgi:hypothetical protein